MAVPVTLVESNPVTTLFNSQRVNDDTMANPNALAGPTIILGAGDQSTYGRQITFVFVTGTSSGSEFDDTLDVRLQGRRGGDFDDMDDIMQRLIVGNGSSVSGGNPCENTATIMYMDDCMLKEMGEADSTGSYPNEPFDAVRYRITCDTKTNEGFLPLFILGIAGDLRYGLFGTNAQLASQLKGTAYGLTMSDSLISANTTVFSTIAQPA
tara:strand:- start:82 stop:711 length:630 start_codon:yes stop_codon:yes gene_type:complete